MSQPSNIDAILEERARWVRQQNREMYMRQLLNAFDANNAAHGLDYAGILRRVQEVVAKELAEVEAVPEQTEERNLFPNVLGDC